LNFFQHCCKNFSISWQKATNFKQCTAFRVKHPEKIFISGRLTLNTKALQVFKTLVSYLPIDIFQNTRRLDSSAPPLRELQISYYYLVHQDTLLVSILKEMYHVHFCNFSLNIAIFLPACLTSGLLLSCFFLKFPTHFSYLLGIEHTFPAC